VKKDGNGLVKNFPADTFSGVSFWFFNSYLAGLFDQECRVYSEW
jgi:hypothetical protein